jgi:hypothetical protein
MAEEIARALKRKIMDGRFEVSPPLEIFQHGMKGSKA